MAQWLYSEASPATQREIARVRAHELGAHWVGSYEDNGISAYTGAARPSLDRLIAACHAGLVDVIITFNISRLSRADPLDVVPVLIDLLDRGVTIVSIVEGEFRRGNASDLIRLVAGLNAAHAESRSKSAAVSAVKAAARELGGYLSGKAPYGFALAPETRHTADGDPFVIQRLARRDDEAAVIRHVVGRLLDADSPATLTGIAAALNADGIPTRGATVGKQTANSAWCLRTLDRIVRDPRVAGFAAEVVYADRTRPDGRPSASVAGYRIVRDPDGRPIEAHPRIIDPETWFRLQHRLDRRPTRAAPLDPPRPALLSALGILYCECGAAMKSHRNTRHGFRPAYRCTRPRGVRRPGDHAGDCTISQRALDEHVVGNVFAHATGSDRSWWSGAPLDERRAFVALLVRRITVTKAPGPGCRAPVAERVSILLTCGILVSQVSFAQAKPAASLEA
ncbi:recombinase family protein [Dactylosporangium sp. CS-047395]|uniref:recombinase family protein n=1 Tax=Dactylosporangium sp. CS-047395 TaxID=3239936 RepID=UPI003D93E940